MPSNWLNPRLTEEELQQLPLGALLEASERVEVWVDSLQIKKREEWMTDLRMCAASARLLANLLSRMQSGEFWRDMVDEATKDRAKPDGETEQ